MPRSGSGVYTLPVVPFVAQTTIKSADMNSNLSDLATAMSQSLATTGVSSMTAPIKLSDGTVAAPSLCFASDLTTGFYKAGGGQIGGSVAGANFVTFAAATVTWAGGATFGGNVAITGTVSATGTANFGGTTVSSLTVTVNATVGGTLGVTGKASFTSTDSMAMANGTTLQRNGAPSAGDTRYNNSLNGLEFWNGTSWVTIGQAPTVQRFIAGAANYTPTAGTVRIRVRMCGGGGGGSGATANNGNNGGDTSFGAWTAIHGNGGVQNAANGAAGGTGGANGTGTLIVRLNGGQGSGGGVSAGAGENVFGSGGNGGNNPFAGAGPGGGNQAAGNTAAPNTGGGGGGGSNNGANTYGGLGGGAGEYVEFWVSNPGVIAYSVGGGGGGGAAGGFAGGNGAAGIIIIEEFYS
jgi:hypothetical protein